MKNKLIFAIFITLFFLPWLGLKQLHSRGEAREALVAQSMLISGNYILPKSYSDLVPSKPPMLHWLINIAAKVTGDLNEFSVRLPVALASIIFAFYFALYLQSIGYKNYFIPPLLLITSIQWFRHSNTARVDMLLTVGTVIAILELYKWRMLNGCKSVPWLSLIGLIIAVFSKGPVGLVLPIVIFSIWSFVDNDAIKKIILRCTLISIAVVLIGAIWYLLAYQQAGIVFIDKFLYENTQRFAGTMADDPHKNSITYLYTSIIWSMLPWSLFWIVPTFVWIKNSNRISALKNNIYKVWTDSSFNKLTIIWIVTFILFYSFPEGKRDVYLLPIMPAICVFLTNYLVGTELKKLLRFNLLMSFILWITVILLIIISSVVLVVEDPFSFLSNSNKYILLAIGNFLQQNVIIVLFSLAVSFAVYRAFIKVAFGDSQTIITNIVIKFGVVLIIVQASFFPAVGNAISYKNFADETKELIKFDEKLYSYNHAFYGLGFYLMKRFYEINPEKDPHLNFGKYYLFEKNLDDLQDDLKPGQCLRTILRSTKPMVDPKRYVLLTEVYNCGS